MNGVSMFIAVMAIVSGDGMTVKLGKSGYENDILRVRRKCA